MEKEQAIKKLNDIRCHVKETSAEEQALVMAINALKAQLSCEDTTSDAISRQAAIDRINSIRPVNPKESDYGQGVDVGMAMSIVAIKEQPSAQPVATDIDVGDTISRQAAIDALQKCRKHCIDPFDSYHIDIQDAENQLMKLPTIQPEPKEGHWIDKGWDGDWAWQTDGRGSCWRVIECSECGKSVLVESNFCPPTAART